MEFVEEQGAAIVATGSFNPAIFQPSWLAKEGIITADEEESAKLDVIHPEIARFQIPALKFDVQAERFSMHAVAEPFVRAADMFFMIFGERLSHCPIESVGINYWAHIRLRDWAQRQRLGRALAPIDPWGEFGQLMNADEKDSAGGFSTLTMRVPFLDNGKEGSINVALQPSNRVPDDVGVFIHVNHHFSEDAAGASGFPELVAEKFDASILRARKLVDHFTVLGRAS